MKLYVTHTHTYELTFALNACLSRMIGPEIYIDILLCRQWMISFGRIARKLKYQWWNTKLIFTNRRIHAELCVQNIWTVCFIYSLIVLNTELLLLATLKLNLMNIWLPHVNKSKRKDSINSSSMNKLLCMYFLR